MKILFVQLVVAFVVCVWSRAEEAGPQDLLMVPAAEPRDVGDAPEQADNTASVEGPEAADSVEGEVYPLSRYSALWTRSPFQLESIAPTALSEGIGQRYALTGIAQIDGEPIVFVMDRGTQERSMVKKDGSKSGLALVQIDVQQKYADSTATVRLDGEVGTLKFDAAAVPAAPQMAMPTAPRPIQPGVPQAMIPPQQIPGAVPPMAPPVPPGQPVPAANGVANGQVQADPNNPQQGQPPRVIRRRAIIPAAP
jgi:hypothetical protein